MTEKKKDLIKLSAEHFNFLKFFANIEGDIYSVPWKYKLFRENDDGTAYLEIIMPENQSIKP